jgi:NADPH-dependent curcumin reductase CurA
MSQIPSREIRLKSRPATRPAGMPTEGNFELATKAVDPPGPGEVLVRNIWMSVDPYMRGRMTEGPSYIPAFKLGEALEAEAIGRVLQSNAAEFKTGDFVVSMLGFREYYTASARDLEKIDCAEGIAVRAYLGALGRAGLTAYVGLFKIGELKPGETVFVSGAAGAVGSIACQIAKIHGCTVIGSAGSDEKCAWLTSEVGTDYAINYKTAGDLNKAVRAAAPGGIDVYFENVGGAHLIAALGNMKVKGRMAICGMISRYNGVTDDSSVPNIIWVLRRQLKMQGFLVGEYWDLMPQFRAQMVEWARTGKICWRETVVEGIENAPRAFLGLFNGDNLGKMLVKIGPDGAI